MTFPFLIRYIIRDAEPDFIIGDHDVDGNIVPYVKRWYLRRQKSDSWLSNIYVHHFLRSDDDRSLHDHPFNNVSIILFGSYREYLDDGMYKIRKPWRPWAPWRMTYRKAEVVVKQEF